MMTCPFELEQVYSIPIKSLPMWRAFAIERSGRGRIFSRQNHSGFAYPFVSPVRRLQFIDKTAHHLIGKSLSQSLN
jgi:hypothetical protein